MNVRLPSGICPLCVFSIKLCPIIGAKLRSHWDNFPGSTVPIKIMWRAKCPIKLWRCPFAHFVSSLYNCAPLGAKQRFTGTISRFRRHYMGPNKGLIASLGHKGAPLPTVCLLNITVPRNGEKSTFRDKNIWGNRSISSPKKGHVFLLKWPFLLR